MLADDISNFLEEQQCNWACLFAELQGRNKGTESADKGSRAYDYRVAVWLGLRSSVRMIYGLVATRIIPLGRFGERVWIVERWWVVDTLSAYSWIHILTWSSFMYLNES